MQKPKTKNQKPKTSSGFTLIETMVAVFILALIVTSMLGIVAQNIFASRYGRNEIIATYLLQEAVDYIRNDRDSVAFQGKGGGNWDIFLAKYTSKECNTTGCNLDIRNGGSVNPCSYGICDPLYYYNKEDNNTDYFYFYDDIPDLNKVVPTSFKRKVEVKQNGLSEIDVKVTVSWMNGNLSRSKSLTTSLLKWQ